MLNPLTVCLAAGFLLLVVIQGADAALDEVHAPQPAQVAQTQPGLIVGHQVAQGQWVAGKGGDDEGGYRGNLIVGEELTRLLGRS